MRKKLLSILALLCLTVTSAWAASWTSGSCTVTLTSGTLTVSGTGAMDDYTSLSYVPWKSVRTSITSIVINDGVTRIGDNAFYGCSNLTSVNIGSGVTSIGQNAFITCSNLTTVDIPDNVETIGVSAFQSCTRLTTVTIGKGATNIDRTAFYGCSDLVSFTVDGDNTAYSSEDDVLFNKSKTTLFKYPAKKSGTTYNIPATVTTIEYAAFAYCSSLTTIDIPYGVTTLEDFAFIDCSGLTSITIPASVTTIEWCAFQSCSGLTSITLPASVTTIGNNVFNNCSSLASVTIYAPSLTTYGYNAFGDDITAPTIYVFSDCVATYRSGWSEYFSSIEAISDVTVSGVTARQDPENTADYWSTYYHPAANVSIRTEGVEIFKASLSGSTLTLTKVDGSVIKAGQPVVLKATAGGDLSMQLTSTTTASDFSGNDLKGTTASITGAAGNIYVLNAKAGTGAGFYKLKASGTLSANKAYLTYSGSSAPEYLDFNEDNTTAVSEALAVKSESLDADAAWYTLHGVKLAGKPVQKGVYVVNGRKVVIK